MMSQQLVTIEVGQETAEVLETLKAKAAARGLSLDAYLRTLAERDVSLTQPPKPTLEEFDRDMDQLASGLDGLPILPRDFSRADMYADHD
ncbi:MAG: hypothetical protein HY314_05975 [Acidobacteria bacterium]|nr:hypothetical protein [Acidobacteriota bacterium]